MEEYNSDSLLSLGSEEEPWSSGSQTSSEEQLSWINWWCAHQGHEYFAEVPEEFIEDDFNMTGLASDVDFYKQALELILDLEPDEEDEYEAADQESVEASAEILYSLVHQRYICSRNGLITMAEKYEAGHFGVCPRVMCVKTAVLPVGLSDAYGESNVKLYCPSCLDIYNPPNSRFYHIDGSSFGTTFPHLFFMTFPDLKPEMPKEKKIPIYVPRIYGFKVSDRAVCGPKMSWLRQYVHHGRLEAGQTIEGEQQQAIEPPKTSADIVQKVMQPAQNRPQALPTSPKSARTSLIKDQIMQDGNSAQSTRKQVIAVRESKVAT